MKIPVKNNDRLSRRSAMQGLLALAGAAAIPTIATGKDSRSKSDVGALEARDKTKVKITRLETFLVKPRWIFLKVHTDAGVVGLGEPLLEGRALTIQTAIKEIEPYLIGKDPRQVVHHWQAIYRHAFYRGGPI